VYLHISLSLLKKKDFLMVEMMIAVPPPPRVAEGEWLYFGV